MSDAADAERPWGKAWARPEKPVPSPADEAAIALAPGETHVLGRRVLAHVLDVAASVALAVFISIQWLGDVAPASWLASADGSVAWLIAASGLNWVLLQGLTGFSAGKLVTGIRVVDVRGQAPGLKAALFRTLPLVIEQWGILGLWAANRSPVRQRFGDRWAGTYVVRARVDRAAALVSGLMLAALIALFAWGFR